MRLRDQNGVEYEEVPNGGGGGCLIYLLLFVLAIFALPVVLGWMMFISENNRFTRIKASLSSFKRWVLMIWVTYVYYQMIKPMLSQLLVSGDTIVPDMMVNFRVYHASILALILLVVSTIVLSSKKLNMWSGTSTVQSETITQAIGVAMFTLVGSMVILGYLMTRMSFMMTFQSMNLFYAGIISLILTFFSYFIAKIFLKSNR